VYVPLLSFNLQREHSGKRMPEQDPESNVARFSSIIDDMDESGAELDGGDADSTLGGPPPSSVAQQRPPSTSGMDRPESSADTQLQSLLRDEFIIRHVFLS